MTNRYPSRINWENEPSIQTPINETNLNRMDNALFNMAADVVSLDNEAFKSVSYDSSNGKFTFVKGNGQTYVLDTALEKIATNFRYDSTTQSLILTLADGTTQSIDLSDMITNVDLEDSTTISWTITSGKAKANIINGSITSDKLQPNYLSDITNQANKATTASTNAAKDKLVAEGYANGKQNGVPVDSTSPYYHNNAEYFKDQAQAVSHVEIATTTTPGIVKPDGTTITVEADGTIHGANTYTLPTASASTLGGIKVGTNLTIEADGTLNATGGSSITGYGKSLEYDEDSSELSLKDESGNVLSTVTIEGGSVKSLINVTTEDFIGQTVTCSNAAETLTSTFSSTGQAQFKVSYVGTYTITCGTKEVTVSVTALGDVYSITINDTVTINLTVEGAKEDNITIYDSANEIIANCIFSSGATSGAVTLTIPSNGGSYNFVSSVAKDTTSETSNYSKTITLSSNTTNVKAMPDGAIYWYGNECVDKTGGWTGDGWNLRATTQSGYSAGTKNTNNIRVYTTENATGQILGTVNMVDVTQYNSATVHTCAFVNCNGSAMLSKKQIQPQGQSDSVFLTINSGTKTTNISSITGSYYLCIWAINGGGYSVDFIVCE